MYMLNKDRKLDQEVYNFLLHITSEKNILEQ